MNASYFDQFNIKKLLFMKSSETMMSMSNLTMMMSIIMLMLTSSTNNKMLPTRNSMMMQILHTMSNNLTKEHLLSKHHTHTPMMFTMFTILMTINLTGLLPYTFTPTSHMMITFSLSLTMMMKTTLSATMTHKSKMLSMFTPNNTPLMLAPFLMLMETTSYMTRAISLGIRLAANISAGHLLLTMLSKFTLNMMLTSNIMLSMMPMMALFFISFLEMMVAMMQAYVFTLLTTMYLSDTMKLH